jgi:hypothetical protein
MNRIQEILLSALVKVFEFIDRIFGTSFIKKDTEFIALTSTNFPQDAFISDFNSVKQWLFHICDNAVLPKTTISDYLFVLYGARAHDTLTIYGYNLSRENNVSTSQVDFTLPLDMCMTLHQKDYTELSKKILRERIKNEIKEFTQTSKFYSSFLSKSRTISLDSKGDIWAA